MWREKVGGSAGVAECWSAGVVEVRKSYWSAGLAFSTVEREVLKLEFFVTKFFFKKKGGEEGSSTAIQP